MGKRQRLVRSLRGRAAAIRSHTRTRWAVGLAKGYQSVCCERMDAARLKRSARGTHEKHGELVGVQRDHSRRLSDVAPGEQRAELKVACERHGAKYIETPATNSSEFCPECGHCTSENRKSQARFQCYPSAGTPTTPMRTPRGTTSRGERRRSTGLRSGGPGRRQLLQSAKLAGATRSGHRRQAGAVPRGGNRTPDQGRPRLPRGALRPPLRWVQRRVRPRQQQIQEDRLYRLFLDQSNLFLDLTSARHVCTNRFGSGSCSGSPIVENWLSPR